MVNRETGILVNHNLEKNIVDEHSVRKMFNNNYKLYLIEHLGRVQIKVYRGPTDDAEEYAPWGFWVKQPAEDNY